MLELVRDLAPVSRAEISRRAGISKPTVSLALRSLVEAGLVRESAEAPSGPSYGAVYFEPVPEAALVLGLDLGARFLRGAICDLSGTIRARQDVELQGADAERALAAVAELRDALVAATDLPGELIDGVVVGVPGVTGAADGTLQLAANVPGLEGRPFEAELEARLGLPITLENDINLAALGERWLGVARGVDDFVFLSVGTGMGAGIVLRGELHTGTARLRRGDRLRARSARRGRRPVRSADRRARGRGRRGSTTRRACGRRSTRDRSSTRPAEGDEAAQLVVAEVARRIALHLAPVAAVVDVELVVLGGGIGSNGDLLLEPVRRLLASWLPFPPQVEVSTVGEAAVLAGALAVGLRAALENVARTEVA